MMKQVTKEILIQRAKELIGQLADPVHGMTHMERTLGYALEIAQSYPETDLDILELDVWWHDVGRIYCDDGHAQKSGEMVRKEFSKFNIDRKIIDRVYGDVIAHSNKSGLRPQNLEGKILLDADKLEFLTPARWQEAIEAKDRKALQIGVEKVAVIRDKILLLDKSKEIFDVVLSKLILFIKSKEDAFFEEFKNRIAIDWGEDLKSSN